MNDKIETGAENGNEPGACPRPQAADRLAPQRLRRSPDRLRPGDQEGDVRHLARINLNLIWGILMLAIGGGFLLTALLKRNKKPD